MQEGVIPVLIEPFRGILYDKKKIKNLKAVYSLPYDVICPKQRDAFYASSPYNIIRIILNRPCSADDDKNNPCSRGAKFFNRWCENGILKQDKEPGIYVYGQSFRHNKKLRRTFGFIAAAHLGRKEVERAVGHENIFKASKEDRERMLAAAGANLSCVYTLFDDEGFKVDNLLCAVCRAKPFIDVKIDNVRHRLWKMRDEKTIKKLQAVMKGKRIFIADGHHRYQAAVSFRERMRRLDKKFSEKKSYNHIMLYFAGMQNPGLTILPTHRLLKNLGLLSASKFVDRLGKFFDIFPTKSLAEMLAVLNTTFGAKQAFGIYLNKRFSVMVPKDKNILDKEFGRQVSNHYKKLDVVLLHKIIFDKILAIDSKNSEKGGILSYTRDEKAAVQSVDKGRFAAAFFLKPIKASEIRDVSLEGGKMPHKSTYFYPKLLTGIVMRRLEDVPQFGK